MHVYGFWEFVFSGNVLWGRLKSKRDPSVSVSVREPSDAEVTAHSPPCLFPFLSEVQGLSQQRYSVISFMFEKVSKDSILKEREWAQLRGQKKKKNPFTSLLYWPWLDPEVLINKASLEWNGKVKLEIVDSQGRLDVNGNTREVGNVCRWVCSQSATLCGTCWRGMRLWVN